MFKTRFGGNAFFLFLKSVTEALSSFGAMTIIVIVAAAFAAVYAAAAIIFCYGFNKKFGLCGYTIPPEILAYTEDKFRAEGKNRFPGR